MFALFFCSLVFPEAIFSFHEDFVEGFSYPEKWNLYDNSNTFENILEGELSYASFYAPKGTDFPYLTTKEEAVVDQIFSSEVRFRVNKKAVNFGAGVFVISTDVSQNGDGLLAASTELFKVWVGADHKFMLYTTLCDKSNADCDINAFHNIKEVKTEGDWHIVSFHRVDDHYEISFDEDVIFISAQTTRFPKYLWIGHSEHTGVVSWPSFDVDYVRINESPSNEITPVLIIPGLGASWNYSAILNNVESDNWSVPEWIDIYDNLISALEQAGYTMDEDLFVFTYDWRKRLDELGVDLKDYLDNLISLAKIQEGEKLNIIGHSYGGLVGRSYLHQSESDVVGQLITVGSPHEGSALAYGAWEGAQLWGRPWWQKVALEVLLELNRLPRETKVEAIQRMSPSLIDLLPVYHDYLYDTQAEVWKNNLSLYQQNLTLQNWKSRVGEVNDHTIAVGGNNRSTLKTVNVVERNLIDKVLGQWEDGKPEDLNYSSQGDGTVLASSAFSDLSNFSSVDSDHLDLVSNNQGLSIILETIGLKAPTTEGTLVNKSEDALIVLLESPGDIRLIDPQSSVLDKNSSEFEGYFVSDPKMILVPSPSLGSYQVEIVESGEIGQYHLHIGIVRGQNTEWLSFWGNLKSGEVDYFKVVLDESGVTAADSEAYDYEEIIEELLVKIDSLMDAWKDRAGQRAGLFYTPARNNLRLAYSETDNNKALLLLGKSRYLLNQLSRQAELSEKLQLAEDIEELLYKIDDWSYQFGEADENEAEKIKLVLERMIEYKENELMINFDKREALGFVKASLLKEKGDDLYIKQKWGQARETYLSAWFWLIKS